MVAILVQVFIPDPYLVRLEMPDEISFTDVKRRGHGFIVNAWLDSHNWYGLFVAFVAALLVFILLFVETEITEFAFIL